MLVPGPEAPLHVASSQGAANTSEISLAGILGNLVMENPGIS